ncbi:hypothetical protein AB0B94_02720 [Micromonospora sp. NPDC048986]|uniref:hypothetical protein n=1 Tax=Micromonospora sp. NPDC048986 TaxID=3155644 RepID=UPI00340EF471
MPPTTARCAGRRGRICVVAAVVLLLLSAAYLTATLRYELGAGSFSAHPQSFSDSSAGGIREYRYLAQPDRTIEYGFSIANRGPVTVALEEVVDQGGPAYSVDRVRMEPDVIRQGITGFHAVPFQPIHLRPDDQVFIWVTLRFSEGAQVSGPCAAFWFDTQSVRFTALGMPREQRVPIGHVITVTTPDADGQPCAAYP